MHSPHNKAPNKIARRSTLLQDGQTQAQGVRPTSALLRCTLAICWTMRVSSCTDATWWVKPPANLRPPISYPRCPVSPKRHAETDRPLRPSHGWCSTLSPSDRHTRVSDTSQQATKSSRGGGASNYSPNSDMSLCRSIHSSSMRFLLSSALSPVTHTNTACSTQSASTTDPTTFAGDRPMGNDTHPLAAAVGWHTFARGC